MALVPRRRVAFAPFAPSPGFVVPVVEWKVEIALAEVAGTYGFKIKDTSLVSPKEVEIYNRVLWQSDLCCFLFDVQFENVSKATDGS